MYEWRNLTPQQRAEVLGLRQQSQLPWHSPPHYSDTGFYFYHLSASCYEHKSIIGASPKRMAAFEFDLQKTLTLFENRLCAWCILPNHWHALIQTKYLQKTIHQIGRLHGRTSFKWNKEDGCIGRKCWHRCVDRRIRSDAHRFATQNYIHHNPVKHGYTQEWSEWAFSSAADYLAKVGRDKALELWKKYPVLKMGKNWDENI